MYQKGPGCQVLPASFSPWQTPPSTLNSQAQRLGCPFPKGSYRIQTFWLLDPFVSLACWRCTEFLSLLFPFLHTWPKSRVMSTLDSTDVPVPVSGYALSCIYNKHSPPLCLGAAMSFSFPFPSFSFYFFMHLVLCQGSEV